MDENVLQASVNTWRLGDHVPLTRALKNTLEQIVPRLEHALHPRVCQRLVTQLQNERTLLISRSVQDFCEATAVDKKGNSAEEIFNFLITAGFQPAEIGRLQKRALDIQSVAKQCLTALRFLHEDMRLTHTDLKLENVPWQRWLALTGCTWCDASRDARPSSTVIKLIDFGNATYESEHHSAIINTRQYRAPEVILSVGWTERSDLWSTGCIVMELYTGELLFRTHESLEHLVLMERSLERFPQELLSKAGRRPDGRFVMKAPGVDSQGAAAREPLGTAWLRCRRLPKRLTLPAPASDFLPDPVDPMIARYQLIALTLVGFSVASETDCEGRPASSTCLLAKTSIAVRSEGPSSQALWEDLGESNLLTEDEELGRFHEQKLPVEDSAPSTVTFPPFWCRVLRTVVLALFFHLAVLLVKRTGLGPTDSPGPPADPANAFACSALHVAAAEANLEDLQRLLEAEDLDVNAVDAWDETALHMAGGRGSLEACQLLIEAKADVNAVNANDETPLKLVTGSDSVPLCHLLLQHGAHLGAPVAEDDMPQCCTTALVESLLASED
eukprot:Skav222635  [mRNA]  locus=scaffold10:209075:226052:+ [translate_table: standard]